MITERGHPHAARRKTAVPTKKATTKFNTRATTAYEDLDTSAAIHTASPRVHHVSLHGPTASLVDAAVSVTSAAASLMEAAHSINLAVNALQRSTASIARRKKGRKPHQLSNLAKTLADQVSIIVKTCRVQLLTRTSDQELKARVYLVMTLREV